MSWRIAEQVAPARSGLREELAAVLNRHSREGRSGTPDFILAEYLLGCLDAFERAAIARERWNGGQAPRDEEVTKVRLEG